jgi:hypothetical protein
VLPGQEDNLRIDGRRPIALEMQFTIRYRCWPGGNLAVFDVLPVKPASFVVRIGRSFCPCLTSIVTVAAQLAST